MNDLVVVGRPSALARPVLEATALAVGRGGRIVLEGLDLQVAAGERIALVGANGSGKTTLLRALAGLDSPLAGTVRWAGQLPMRGAARVRHVGVLFQTEASLPFTVREIVTLGLGLERPANAAERATVADTLARFDLTALADRRCSALSGGESQRAALARALVADPRVLLLDEPTNHLDPARRAALTEVLASLHGQVAVVLASHDLEIAAAADRVALLGSGRLLDLGSAREVLTADGLQAALGVRVRRLEDPQGGPPFLRVEASA